MLSQIKAFVDLTKQVPEAVGYDTFGPITFPIPDEIRAAIPGTVAERLEEITLFSVRVDNFSNRAQRNLRILFSGRWSFAPRIHFHRRDVKPKYELRTEDKEIVILEIPPNESVSIELFNPSAHFNIEQVLIGDLAVTDLMQKLAEARRYPGLAKLRIATAGVITAMAFATMLAGYVIWTKESDRRLIESAHAGFASCVPYVYANRPGDEVTVERKFLQAEPYFRGLILSLNKVDNLSQLKLKDRVVLCDADKP